METQTKKNKIFGAIKKGVLKLAVTAFCGWGILTCLWGVTQLPYIGNNLINSLNPSKQRQEFKQEFGFPIQGWKADIENNGEVISTVAEAVYKEKIETPFDLKALIITPNNFFKKSFVEKMHLRSAGMYRINKNIVHLTDSSNLVNVENAAYHEIKHAKSYKIIKEHPEFIEKWKAISGNNYISDKKSLENLVNGDPNNLDYEDFGFVTEYAQTDVDEDIAELGCMVEMINGPDGSYFTRWLEEKKNPIIIAKVKLAQEYGIIPKEFSEYIKLGKILEETENYVNQEKMDTFIAESENFIKKHPKTVYESWARSRRALCLRQEGKLQSAIKEYKQTLNSQFKGRRLYNCALDGLSICYQLAGNKEKGLLYENAEKEYKRRYKSGDLKLPIKGVNDYLAAHGEDLGGKGK